MQAIVRHEDRSPLHVMLIVILVTGHGKPLNYMLLFAYIVLVRSPYFYEHENSITTKKLFLYGAEYKPPY